MIKATMLPAFPREMTKRPSVNFSRVLCCRTGDLHCFSFELFLSSAYTVSSCIGCASFAFFVKNVCIFCHHSLLCYSRLFQCFHDLGMLHTNFAMLFTGFPMLFMSFAML